MPIGYKDFFPAVLKSSFFSEEREALTATVARANAWIDACRVRILNVETVLFPNIEDETKTSQGDFRTSGEMRSKWYQTVRVWYETPDPSSQIG